jgi:hypothetical protein
MAGLLFLAAFPNRSFALEPSQPFSSYLKTHFTNDDGLPGSLGQNGRAASKCKVLKAFFKCDNR